MKDRNPKPETRNQTKTQDARPKTQVNGQKIRKKDERPHTEAKDEDEKVKQRKGQRGRRGKGGGRKKYVHVGYYHPIHLPCPFAQNYTPI